MMFKFLFLAALLVVLNASTIQANDDDVLTEPKPIGRCPPRDIPNKPTRFLPDANDCRVYYKCVEGVPERNVCPVGTCFSRRTKGCEVEP